MKYILVFIINIYERLMAPAIRGVFTGGGSCRFEETCSQYSVRAIKEKGAIKGTALAVRRILSCQPFYSGSLKYESI